MDVFSKILSGEIPAHKVYEDEQVFAFLDIQPKAQGHTLIIPKIKSETVWDTDEEVLSYITITGKRIAHALRKLGAEGVRFQINNGVIANQEVPYIHLHIIPFYEEGSPFGKMGYSEGEAEEMIKKIQGNI
jgi:histidine triad (HIT) family protein